MDSSAGDVKILDVITVLDTVLCRLCASQSQQTVNVFDEEVAPLDLVNTIRQCLQVKISANDLLPKDICLSCCEKLRDCSEFFTLCAQSQKSLTELYNTNITVQTENDSFKELLLPAEILPKGDQRKCKRKLRKPHRIVADSIEELSLENLASEEARSCDPPIVVIEDGPMESTVEALDDGPDNSRFSSKEYFATYIWRCTICDEAFANLTALKLHCQELHQSSPDFKCDKCGKIYNRYTSFVRHVKLHNDPKRFTCLTCGKKFSQKSVLQSHRTVHTEERPYVCPQCGKAFKQHSSLYLHSRTHLPEQAKPKFFCSVCKKTFSSKRTMETHVKTHTGEKNYSCEICGKGFISKGSLKYHIQSHDEARNFTCTLCHKSFKTERMLAKHASLHTGVKPHQCDVCGKQFRERSDLKEHARTHTGEMPYVCEYCGKAFRYKGILTVHIRQHTGERPYRCSDCPKIFANWANYNKHTRRRHQRSEPFSPPSISLPSIDFGDPNDLPLSADALSIQEFVIDHELFRIPSSYSNLSGMRNDCHSESNELYHQKDLTLQEAIHLLE